MGIFKWKKGPAEGVSAYVLFITMLLIGNIMLQMAYEFDVMSSPEGFIMTSLFNTSASIFGILMYFWISRSLINQGKKKGGGNYVYDSKHTT